MCSDGRDFVVGSLGPDDGETAASSICELKQFVIFFGGADFALRDEVWAWERAVKLAIGEAFWSEIVG